METSFTGAHLLHLAVAGCVLNDVFREAERLGVIVYGVRVTASGGFNTETWESTGIGYVVDVDSPASAGELDALLEAVDSVAEIPKSIRAGAPVERMGVDEHHGGPVADGWSTAYLTPGQAGPSPGHTPAQAVLSARRSEHQTLNRRCARARAVGTRRSHRAGRDMLQGLRS